MKNGGVKIFEKIETRCEKNGDCKEGWEKVENNKRKGRMANDERKGKDSKAQEAQEDGGPTLTLMSGR